MFFFILGIIAILAGLGAILIFRSGWGALGILVGIVLVVLSCITTVPAQSVGVVTEFNKPTGQNMGPGLHSKKPWQKVSDMDGTIQSLDNEGVDGRTTVRLNNNSLMYVENNLRWKIVPEAAPQLFLDWKKGDGEIVRDRIGRGLVDKELKAALNVALASYDPLTIGAKNQSNDQLAASVVTRLNERIGTKITVTTFTITRVDFDPDTQARITQYQAEVANTRSAEQREKTAEADARANKVLSGSVSNNPNVLVSKCLDSLNRLVDKGQPIPPAFSCWPGTNTQVVTPTN